MTQVTSAAAKEAPKTPANQKTPNRITNNYADATTPITSMKPKRPRSSLNGAPASSAQPGRLSNTEVPLSPMHPVKPVHRDANDGVVKLAEETKGSSSWVTRKVDALFSPVLRMLEHSDEDEVVVHGLPRVQSEEEEHSDDCSISIQGQEMPESDEFNPWQFIQSLPPYQEISYLRPNVCLPPKDPQAPPITLVLDLDETLVHCSVEPVDDADLVFPVDFHGITYQVHVKKRPYLETFLEACCGKFEVVLFTASQKIYANELLNRIDPEGKYIQHRLYRDSCLPVEGNFLKDLTVLGRDLAQTILVDNSPHAFGYQVENGIPIESWFEDPDDRELIKLERFLRQHCLDVPDVRPILDKKFQCRRLVNEAPPILFGDE
ncbi:hypothetical protein FisN_8Hh087 [Fistulifera solaris]|uniref:FCP1 homology domain-containing protein n=1 Tax=Fistulifera solaris TaxID=1519565 RepID=A0A1Z5JJ84_FISSO|nr:hypothetical protein FisN_8Hh087 [Fistulifera solaris]|eukprot:GAX14077.1 hypothetical protein FisN_8Hh087 [Fistulifera solaris]